MTTITIVDAYGSQIAIPIIRQKYELPLKALAKEILNKYEEFSLCTTPKSLRSKIHQIMSDLKIELCQDLSAEHVKMLVGIQEAVQGMISQQKTTPKDSKQQFIFLLHKCLEVGRFSRSHKARLEDWAASPINRIYNPTITWLFRILVQILFHPMELLSYLIHNSLRKTPNLIYTHRDSKIGFNFVSSH